jgi:hypothetical protein
MDAHRQTAEMVGRVPLACGSCGPSAHARITERLATRFQAHSPCIRGRAVA